MEQVELMHRIGAYMYHADIGPSSFCLGDKLATTIDFPNPSPEYSIEIRIKSFLYLPLGGRSKLML